ncbi:putative BTB/POZ domain-containing protein [Acanthamoeba polyphaga mimivirus]|uniref:BTB/POZ domain-containing protein n=1 Tax=Acanthamoeba polyphaga mimivirus Kroon TaxID=3069720 RepID=A0A0G2Y9K5_9VIRU|nr:putative BTB/POZ domain-containing protein [Acanthamoeba polyphaga mimivirus]AKI80502.1 putative BTB/POZ domain-containing protein [Acanthamoeba polyphaga mimivirus Kroon]
MANIQLVIKDDSDSITLNINRDILCSKIDYFNKMFNNFAESTKEIVSVNVLNAQIVSDLIDSRIFDRKIIADKKNWKYILDLCKCQDYFGIEIDSELMVNLVVPREYFDYLLDVINIVGYNKHTIMTIIQNVPIDFNIEVFPSTLINNMVPIITNSIKVFGLRSSIYIVCLKTREIMYSLPTIESLSNCFCHVKKKNLVFFINELSQLIVFDIRYGTSNIISLQIKKEDFNTNPNYRKNIFLTNVFHSNNSDLQIIPTVNIIYNKKMNQLIFCHDHKHVVVIDADSYRVINMYTHSIYSSVNINNICYNADNNTVVINHSNNVITIWNLVSYDTYTHPKFNSTINLIGLLYHNRYIYKNKFRKIFIKNFYLPVNPIELIPKYSGEITFVESSPDGKYIVIVVDNCQINLFDLRYLSLPGRLSWTSVSKTTYIRYKNPLSIIFRSDNTMLIIFEINNKHIIHVYDLKSKKIIEKLYLRSFDPIKLSISQKIVQRQSD